MPGVSLGIAEADPSHDLEGRDSAVKGCALANALMGAATRPASVARRGITRITAREPDAEVVKAEDAGSTQGHALVFDAKGFLGS